MNARDKRIWTLAVELTMNGSAMAALVERGELKPERMRGMASEMCEHGAKLLAIAVMGPAFDGEVRDHLTDTGVPNP